MKNLVLNTLVIFCLIISIIYLDSGGQAKAGQQTVQMLLSKGQMFSVIAPIVKEGGESARKQYYSQVLPLATQLGLKREGQVKVTETVAGDYNSKAFAFFSWPDVNAENNLYANSKWATMKALRSKGWDELRIYSAAIEQDTQITFSADKFYTLAIAWTNTANPSNYARYMNLIEDKLKECGGRFMYKMVSPRFEAHATDLPAPGQLTFVEWDSADGLSRFQQSPEIKAQSTLLRAGVSRFEFYRLAV